MKTTVSVLTLIVAALLAVAPSYAAVNNVNLAAVGDSGITGMATTISGEIAGATPYYNVEVNMRLNMLPSANMSYEGWLVDNDSNYKLSLGAFNLMRLNASLQLPHFRANMPYDAIAVSLEPINDTNPMPATIIAMGNLPGSSVSAADFTRVAVLPADEMFQQQAIMDRFGLNTAQFTDLRMQGWGYSDIAVVANAASRANRSPIEIARMLSQGQSWDQIAIASDTTVAMLLQPTPLAAVAGYRAEVQPSTAPPAGMIQVPMFYKQLPNGRQIITQDYWNQLSKAGYSWKDVAVAANIASMTGDKVDDLLRMVRVQGMTWRQIAVDRALDMDKVMDVSGWPFGETAMEKTPMPSAPPMTTSPSGSSY